MSIPTSIQQWIKQVFHSDIVSIESIAGGCINQTYAVRLQSGEQCFAKFHPSTSMFEAEARGLTAINNQVAQFAPKPLAWREDSLLLEYLQPVPATEAYWAQLGEKLAQMHQTEQAYFGFEMDNFCGETPQPNTRCNQGGEFFARHRLMYQAELAYQQHKLDTSLLQKIETLASQLERWIPEQSPVLIHGDLWSGNAMNTTDGAKIFDPAAYYGWAEAELAMTTLFGSFDEVFYQSYQQVSGIEPQWRERASLYNLYHLLNHLNLFGGHYLQSVRSVVERYV